MGTELGHPALSLGRDARAIISLGGGSASAACRKFFTLFRIDHVLGFYRIYAFPVAADAQQEFLSLWTGTKCCDRTGGKAPHFAPRDDSSWENCEANQREGEEYLRVVLEESGATRVVGEDLGTVPDYVRPSLRSLGIAGFKIPQWEVYDGRVTPGNEYERLSRRDLRHARSQTVAPALGRGLREEPAATREQSRRRAGENRDFRRNATAGRTDSSTSGIFIRGSCARFLPAIPGSRSL